MPSFEMPDGPTSITLKPVTLNNQTTNTGTGTFSVTNKVSSPVGARLSILTEADAKGGWFDIQGEKERTFAGSETQKITVTVKVPGNVPPGDYKLRCRVVNVTDPDNDYTNSAVVTVNVPPPVVHKPSGGMPWWIWLVIGGVVLLIIIGVVLFFVFSGGPAKVAVPNVTSGLSYTDAATQITGAGLVAQKDPNPATSGTPNTVVAENPGAGQMVDKGSTVVLSVAPAGSTPPPTVTVPDVSSQHYSYEFAAGVLSQAGFTNIQKQPTAPQGNPPNSVYKQVPAALANVPAGTTVTLSVDPGVSFYNVIGSQLGNVISDLNSKFTVTVTVSNDGQATDQIFKQTLNPGQVYAKGQPLSLGVHGPIPPKCIGFKCYTTTTTFSAQQYMMQRSISPAVKKP